MKLYLLFMLLIISTHSKNLGHRAGGGPKEYFKKLPENSIIALEASTKGIRGQKPIQSRKSFQYLEFDVRETLDSVLVVFHDWTLARLVENKGKNKKILKKLSKVFSQRKMKPIPKKGESYSLEKIYIHRLKYSELKQFFIGKDHSLNQHVPTLENFLNAALDFGIKKPVAVELKHIWSEKGKASLIQIVNKFRHHYRKKKILKRTDDFPFDRVGFLAFSSAFEKGRILGKSKKLKTKWCSKLVDDGYYVAVSKVGKHKQDVCKGYIQEVIESQPATQEESNSFLNLVGAKNLTDYRKVTIKINKKGLTSVFDENGKKLVTYSRLKMSNTFPVIQSKKRISKPTIIEKY